MALPYNLEDKDSIIDYAKKLKGKSLNIACKETIGTQGYIGKGSFGQALEKFYFLYEPNSDSKPDFDQAGMELKASPLRRLSKGGYGAKERLVLNIINYLDIIGQNFDNSSFWKKNAHLLLVFYLHEKGTDILDYIIKLVSDWQFPDTDLEIIKRDWELIKEKVNQGKAHELSEGDTFYLGACTKGANAQSVRKQPNSNLPAKQRAFSLKQGYVNHIVASIAKEEQEIYGKLIKSREEAKKKSIEEIVLERFKPYYGLSIDEILECLPFQLNREAKNFYASLTKAILGIELDKNIEEFEKAEIEIKTVRLKENNLPKEDISFPNFKYTEIVNEEWEDSAFKNILEHKFLFVFFQYKEGVLQLRKVKFWNMPYEDLLEAERVWSKTKEIVLTGGIVNRVEAGIRYTNLPNKGFSKVSHVRPHAKKATDTYPLPVKDKVTGADAYTKHCFWLNNSYIRDEIYLK